MKKSEIYSYLDQFEIRVKALQSNSRKRIAAEEAREWIDWLFTSKFISDHERSSFMDRISESVNVTIQNDGLSQRMRVVLIYLLVTIVLLFAFGFSLRYIFSILNERDKSKSIPSTIPFHAVLSDSEARPIDKKTDVIFKIYSSSTSQEPLFTGPCLGESGITPDYKGEFTILLGSDCGMSPLPPQLFSELQILYLGVTIGNSPEIQPRYQIPTSVYSQNASRLDSKPVGAEKNTIPYINENNVIEFNDENPSLKSTNGELSLSALSLSLKTTGVDAGDIVFQPGNFANTIVPVGNLGIGTFSPSEKLSVFANEPNRKIGSFVNLATDGAPDLGVLSLGLGLSEESQGDYVSFYKSSTKESIGNKIGSISINNSAVTYGTTASGMAEHFESIEEVPDGYIVGLSSSGVRKARTGDVILGVASSDAAFVGNQSTEQTGMSILVSMNGQTNVLVSNESDSIQVGDSVELGSLRGVARKGVGARIGYAISGTTQLSDDSFQNSLCPTEARSMHDPKGKNIKCGYISVYLKIQ